MRKYQKFYFPIKFNPLILTLGKSEYEFIIDEKNAGIPPLTQKINRSYGKTMVLQFDLPPIYFHHMAVSISAGARNHRRVASTSKLARAAPAMVSRAKWYRQ